MILYNFTGPDDVFQTSWRIFVLTWLYMDLAVDIARHLHQANARPLLICNDVSHWLSANTTAAYIHYPGKWINYKIKHRLMLSGLNSSKRNDQYQPVSFQKIARRLFTPKLWSEYFFLFVVIVNWNVETNSNLFSIQTLRKCISKCRLQYVYHFAPASVY